MEPDPHPLRRDRDVPEAVDPLVLDPVGRQGPEPDVIDRDLETDLLVGLDRVRPHDHPRPHPRPDRTAMPSLRRRLDPGRHHSASPRSTVAVTPRPAPTRPRRSSRSVPNPGRSILKPPPWRAKGRVLPPGGLPPHRPDPPEELEGEIDPQM